MSIHITPTSRFEQWLQRAWRGQEGSVGLPTRGALITRAYRYGLVVVALVWTIFPPGPLGIHPSWLLAAWAVAWAGHLAVDTHYTRNPVGHEREYLYQFVRNAMGFATITFFLFADFGEFHHGGIATLYVLPILEASFYFRWRASALVPLFAVAVNAVFLFWPRPDAEEIAFTTQLAFVGRNGFLFGALCFGTIAYMRVLERFRRRFVAVAEIDLGTIGHGVDSAAENITTAFAEQLQCAVDLWEVTRYPNEIRLTLKYSAAGGGLPMGEVGRTQSFDPADRASVRGLVGHSLFDGEALAVSDVRRDPRYKPARKGTRSELSSPVQLRGDDEISYVLNLEAARANAFDTRDESFADFLTGRVASALSLSRHVQRDELLDLQMRLLWKELVPIASQVSFDDVVLAALKQGHRAISELVSPITLFVQVVDDNVLRMHGWSTTDDSGIVRVHLPTDADVPKDQPGILKRRGDGVAGACWEHNTELYVRDTKTAPYVAVDPSGARYEVNYLEFLGETQSELDIPIRSGARILGVLSVESPRTDAFSDELRPALRAIAVAVAHALSNALRHDHAIEERERLESISHALTRLHDDRQEVLDDVMHDVVDYVGADVAALFVRERSEENGDGLVPFAPASVAGTRKLPSGPLALFEEAGGELPPPADLTVFENFRSSHPDDSLFRDWVAAHHPPRTDWPLMLVSAQLRDSPRQQAGESEGYLALVKTDPGGFDERERTRAQAAAEQLAALLKARQAIEENRRQLDHVTARNEITRVLLDGTSLSDQLRAMVATLREHIGSDACLIYLLEGMSSKLVLKASVGWEPDEAGEVSYDVQEDAESPTVEAALAHEVIRVETSEHVGHFDRVLRPMPSDTGATGFMGRSLRSDGKLEGVVVFLNRKGDDSFSQSDRDRVEAIAPAVALSVAYARNLVYLTEFRADDRATLLREVAQYMSHEIGNRLAVLDGAVYRARHTVADEAALDHLNRIKREIEQLRHTQEALGGVVNFEFRVPGETSVVEVAKGVLSRLEVEAKGMNTKLILNSSERIPAVSMPAGFLEMAIYNLILNAIQSAGSQDAEGTVQLSVGFEEDQIIVAVMDNGPGLPQHLKKVLGERGATASTRPGRGFGLALTKQIIGTYGGELRHPDRPAGGATFIVRLPTPAAGAQR